MTLTSRPFNTKDVLAQIANANLLAISGGRVTILVDNSPETIADYGTPVEYGVELPVSNGYRVKIILDFMDTYTVSREFVRNGTVYNKGTVEDVYFDTVGEIAYQASCFRNVDFGGVKVK